jgi:hypothetical protein
VELIIVIDTFFLLSYNGMFGFLDLMLQYQLMIAPKIEENSFDCHIFIGKEAQNK